MRNHIAKLKAGKRTPESDMLSQMSCHGVESVRNYQTPGHDQPARMHGVCALPPFKACRSDVADVAFGCTADQNYILVLPMQPPTLAKVYPGGFAITHGNCSADVFMCAMGGQCIAMRWGASYDFELGLWLGFVIKARPLEHLELRRIDAVYQPALTGRKYFFDIGTGDWASGSIKWFTTMYGLRHIEFDEIFGEHIQPTANSSSAAISDKCIGGLRT